MIRLRGDPASPQCPRCTRYIVNSFEKYQTTDFHHGPSGVVETEHIIDGRLFDQKFARTKDVPASVVVGCHGDLADPRAFEQWLSFLLVHVSSE